MTFCKQGLHDLSNPANVYVQPSTGKGQCHMCMKARWARRYAEKYDELAEKRRNHPNLAVWDARYRSSEKGKETRRARVRKRRALKRGVRSEPYTLQDIVDRDGTDCALCHDPVDMSLTGLHRMAPSVDHIRPISLRGPDILANVQLAHVGCNSRKGNKVPGV